MMILRILIISSVLFFISCDPMDDRLTIVNKTKDDIFYSLSTIDSVSINPLRIVNSADTVFFDSQIVLADSIYKHGLIGPNEWEYFINRDCQDSTLRIFIFEKKLILNTPWDSIVAKQQYSKKYELTVKELEKLNWQVVYK